MQASQVYAGGRKNDLAALMYAYVRHQVTRREFGQRMRWLMLGDNRG